MNGKRKPSLTVEFLFQVNKKENYPSKDTKVIFNHGRGKPEVNEMMEKQPKCSLCQGCTKDNCFVMVQHIKHLNN